MDMKLYIEINMICITILLIIVFKILRDLNLRIAKKLFIGVLLSSIELFVLDAHLALIKLGAISASISTYSVIYGFYEFHAVFVGYLWSLYILHIHDSSIIKTKWKLILWTLPFLIPSIMCFFSIKTGWIFYIDGAGICHKGSLYFIQLAIGYAYIIWAAVETFFMAAIEKNYIKRKEYFSLSSFVILPLIAGTIQFASGGLPVLCVGITLSYLIVFLSFQEAQISKDSFTGMNNRNELNRFLYSRMTQSSRKKDLYLIIMDIDSFKLINDIYGHVEGDNALLRLSSVLKDVCGTNNCFAARYGGDEFVLIYECDTFIEFKRLQQQITDNLAESNKTSGTKYSISISMGYSMLTDKFQNIQQFIGAADAELYKVKRSKNANPTRQYPLRFL